MAKKHYIQALTNRVTGEIEHISCHEEFIDRDMIEVEMLDTPIPVEVPGEPDIMPGYDIEDFEIDTADDVLLRAGEILAALEVTNGVASLRTGQDNLSLMNKTTKRNSLDARPPRGS